jgi:hypothetical protein
MGIAKSPLYNVKNPLPPTQPAQLLLIEVVGARETPLLLTTKQEGGGERPFSEAKTGPMPDIPNALFLPISTIEELSREDQRSSRRVETRAQLRRRGSLDRL